MDGDVLNLSEEIKSLALDCGFSHVGISSAEPLDGERANLIEWLQNGYQGSMSWMERDPERRTDPEIYVPGTKSVISLAVNYYTPNNHKDDRSRGKISRYAWGDDYHDIVKKMTDDLVRQITELAPGASFRVCCDTAPIMDKAWAVRSGIGWLGKHSNVIIKDIGSWIFLAEILTGIELEPTSPIPDFCGSCTACIDLCPTGAIVEPYVVDSNKCISYLTIEHRGDFPKDAPDLDGWIFGCDVCQDVCPWNRFERVTDIHELEPRRGEVDFDLSVATEIGDEEFRERFQRSPVKRARPEGFRRNALHLISDNRNDIK